MPTLAISNTQNAASTKDENNMAWHGIHKGDQHGVARHSAVQCRGGKGGGGWLQATHVLFWMLYLAQHSTAHCIAVQCSAVQCSAVQRVGGWGEGDMQRTCCSGCCDLAVPSKPMRRWSRMIPKPRLKPVRAPRQPQVAQVTRIEPAPGPRTQEGAKRGRAAGPDDGLEG